MVTLQFWSAALVGVLAALALVPRHAPGLVEPAAQLDPELVVQITSPQPGQRLRGLTDITGYAADRRSASGSGLNERDIQVYLNDSSDPRNLFHYAFMGEDSPSATAALGPGFGQVGFRDAWQACAFPPGAYRLVVWASSLVTPGARNAASVDVEIEPCAAGEVFYSPDPRAPQAGRVPWQLQGPGDGFTRPVTWILADFAIGFDARCLTPNVDCRYGLLFREQPGPGDRLTNTTYAFRVHPGDGTFRLRYLPGGEEGEYVDLFPDTASPAIRRGTATNHLGVLAEGDRLRLFVNGQQVGETRDSQRPWGQLAWVAATDANRRVDVEFDNLVLSAPGPVESLEALRSAAEATAAAPASAPANAPPASAPASAPPVSAPASAPPVSAPASAPPASVLDPIRARLDEIEGHLRRGDCAAARGAVGAVQDEMLRLVSSLMADPSIMRDSDRMARLNQEAGELRPRIQEMGGLAARCAT